MLAGGLPVGDRAFVCIIEVVPDPIPATAPSSIPPRPPVIDRSLRNPGRQCAFAGMTRKPRRGRASAVTSSRNARPHIACQRRPVRCFFIQC